MRTLVTGANGFAGRHASERLQAGGATVIAFAGDIRDAEACRAQVAAAAPEAVLHLAAIASVADAWRQPDAVHAVNVDGTRALLGAVRAEAPAARVVFVSSAEVYGVVAEEAQPIAEDAPLAPGSPYAASKAEAEGIALASGLDCVVARPFPHIGPGQDARFAIASFAAQIAAIEHGDRSAVLRVGNLDARRDLCDVRDVAAAYEALLQTPGAHGAYNVCSGVAHRIGDVLDRLLALATCEIAVEADPDRLRPSDLPLLLGDPSRIASELGWQAEIPLEQTLADVLGQARESRTSS
jgi:GDP-4-dehydro-6-deoxy-D-mannose reductase